MRQKNRQYVQLEREEQLILMQLILTYFQPFAVIQYALVAKSWQTASYSDLVWHKLLKKLYEADSTLTCVMPNQDCRAMALYKTQLLIKEKSKLENLVPAEALKEEAPPEDILEEKDKEIWRKLAQSADRRDSIPQAYRLQVTHIRTTLHYSCTIQALARGLMSLDDAILKLTSSHDELITQGKYSLERAIQFKSYQAAALCWNIPESIVFDPQFTEQDYHSILFKIQRKEIGAALTLSRIKRQKIYADQEKKFEEIQLPPISQIIKPAPDIFKLENFYVPAYFSPFQNARNETISLALYYKIRHDHHYWTSMLLMLYREDRERSASTQYLAWVMPDQDYSARILFAVQFPIQEEYTMMHKNFLLYTHAGPNWQQEAAKWSHGMDQISRIFQLPWVPRAIARRILTMQDAFKMNLSYNTLVEEKICTVEEVVKLTPFQVKKLQDGFPKTLALNPRFTEAHYLTIPWETLDEKTKENLTLETLENWRVSKTKPIQPPKTPSPDATVSPAVSISRRSSRFFQTKTETDETTTIHYGKKPSGPEPRSSNHHSPELLHSLPQHQQEKSCPQPTFAKTELNSGCCVLQ